ncbi:MAG: AraC family transcriptional regulator [Gammaproteobacteria bacterium]|nr:AraC family transcriptional regulator [Gammaproteobacteria bacterium]
MDTLSDILSLLRPSEFMFRGLEAAEPWSLQFPATDGIRCYSLLSGQCWLVVDAIPAPIRLECGDCVLLTKNQAFRMTSDPALRSTDALSLFSEAQAGGVAICNGGGDLAGVGGYFKFADHHAGLLLNLLPAVVHISDASDKAALRASVELMMQELRAPKPGGYLVARHLAHLMLVFALRLHLTTSEHGSVGWLCALGDKQMAAVINAIHEEPAKAWTLQSLAQLACMSRSTFASRFKQVVGTPPMEYLVRWRMLLAGDRLRYSGNSIATIAASLGYESESAFRTAFKRVMGCSPRQYHLGSMQSDTTNNARLTASQHANR